MIWSLTVSCEVVKDVIGVPSFAHLLTIYIPEVLFLTWAILETKSITRKLRFNRQGIIDVRGTSDKPI